MTDLVSVVIIGVGIASFVVGLVGCVILTPNVWSPKDTWFKRSLISSSSLILGIFILILAMDANEIMSELRARDFGALWKSVWSILAFLVPGGVILVLATYVRLVLWEKYEGSMARLIESLRSRRK